MMRQDAFAGYTVRGSEWHFLSSRVRQNAGRPASVVASKNPQSGDCGYVPKLLARGITRLDLITKRAESDQAATFNNLFTLLNYQLLWLAFRKLKRDKAPGVDGITVDQYEANIRLSRFHALLRPQPRRQVQTEKENGDEEVAGEVPGVERLVPREPDETDCGSLADAEREAARSLSVLPRQRQLAESDEVPGSSTAVGVALAAAAESEFASQLGRL